MIEFKEALETLEQLEQAGTKRNIKINILKRYADNSNHILCHIFNWTYDWQHTFGVRLQRFNIAVQSLDVGNEDWNKFNILLVRLSNRDLTGNAAREATNDLLLSSSDLVKKWFTRIINRDLEIGISSKTINKVWPNLIPKYQVAKAEIFKKGEVELSFPLRAETKIDGMRITIVVTRNSRAAYSTGGLDYYPIIGHIVDQLADSGGPGVYDGEIQARAWNKTVSLMRTMHKNMDTELMAAAMKDLYFYIFDCASINNFNSDGEWIDNTPLHERRKELEKLCKTIAFENVSTNIVLVDQEIVNNYGEVDRYSDECLARGYEGIMLKDPNSPYINKRTKFWYKMKPREDIDGIVVGFQEGKGATTKNKLGNFFVLLRNGNVTGCGSGLTKEQREEFWNNKSDLLGMEIEMEQDKIPAGKNIVANFPTFKRIRWDCPRHDVEEYNG